MRNVHIDLSNDTCAPAVFSGYIGEHSETKIVIKLPPRMLTDDITKYQFVFRNSKNEIQKNNIVDVSDINNGNVSAMLTEKQTADGCLMLAVTAIVESGGVIIRRAKTPVILLKVRDSV